MKSDSGFAFNDAQPENYYFFRQDGSDINEPPLKNRALASQYSDFNQAMEFIQNAKNYSGADLSLEAAFSTTGLWNMAGVVNGLVANRRGTNNARLGMKEYAQEQEALTATSEAFTLKNSTLKEVLAKQFSSIIQQIEFNAAVSKIEYGGEMIEVTKQNGQKILADRVIVTVPLTILKNGSIDFSPGLPSTKIDALNKLDMKSGMKVHLKFSTPFWEDLVTANLGSIFGHNFLPEIYISNLGRSETPVITINVMGERAEQFSSMGDSVVNVMLPYLDEIFSSQTPTQSYVQGGFRIMDWSKEPYIYGAYPYPLVGGGLVFRKELAEPIDNRIFFAGEATHFEGHSGTVHGAIETGIRVTQEVEASVT